MRCFLYVVGFFLLAPFATVWAVDGSTKLDIAKANALHEKGVVFVDTRSESSFKDKHIPGAKSLPVLGKTFNETNLTALVAKDKPVVFYCNCYSDSCNLSPQAANMAVKMGYQNVYFLKAAAPLINGWYKAGPAIQKSK